MGVPVLLLLKLHGGGALGEGEVEVGEDDVAAGVQQDVLGLQVAVHEAPKVQVLQRDEHLRARRSACEGTGTLLSRPASIHMWLRNALMQGASDSAHAQAVAECLPIVVTAHAAESADAGRHTQAEGTNIHVTCAGARALQILPMLLTGTMNAAQCS